MSIINTKAYLKTYAMSRSLKSYIVLMQTSCSLKLSRCYCINQPNVELSIKIFSPSKVALHPGKPQQKVCLRSQLTNIHTTHNFNMHRHAQSSSEFVQVTGLILLSSSHLPWKASMETQPYISSRALGHPTDIQENKSCIPTRAARVPS